MISYKTKAWLVFLLGSAHKAGLVPFEKKLLHQLVFLSNCLAPLFEESPDSARIVKYKRGPFYPVVQWNLDHLAATGVIDISKVIYKEDEFGMWMEANYSINKQTQQVLQRCRRINYGRRLDDYLTEVTFAFASLKRSSWGKVALRDRTYDAPGTSEGAFIDFSEQQRNLSVRAANVFREILPAEIAPSRKEQLFLYLQLLEDLVQEKKAA